RCSPRFRTHPGSAGGLDLRQELGDRGVQLPWALDLRDVAAIELEVAGGGQCLLDVSGEADRHERVVPPPYEERLRRKRAQAGPKAIVAVRLVEIDVTRGGIEGRTSARGRVRAHEFVDRRRRPGRV